MINHNDFKGQYIMEQWQILYVYQNKNKKWYLLFFFLKYKNKQFKFCLIWYLLSHNLSKEPSTYSLSYKWVGKVQKRKKKRKLKKHHDTPISNVLWSSPSPPRETKLNTEDGETIYISKNLKYFLMFLSCINQKERKTWHTKIKYIIIL